MSVTQGNDFYPFYDVFIFPFLFLNIFRIITTNQKLLQYALKNP